MQISMTMQSPHEITVISTSSSISYTHTWFSHDNCPIKYLLNKDFTTLPSYTNLPLLFTQCFFSTDTNITHLQKKSNWRKSTQKLEQGKRYKKLILPCKTQSSRVTARQPSLLFTRFCLCHRLFWPHRTFACQSSDNRVYLNGLNDINAKITADILEWAGMALRRVSSDLFKARLMSRTIQTDRQQHNIA